MRSSLPKPDPADPISLQPRRFWIFRVSGAATIEFYENQILLTSNTGESQRISSGTLSPKCGAKKRLFSATLIIRTENGTVRVRRLPKDVASKAYDSICRWWYSKLEPEARRFTTGFQKKNEKWLSAYISVARIPIFREGPGARIIRAPRSDLVSAELCKTFQHVFRLAKASPSYCEAIREHYIEQQLNEFEAFFDTVESNPLTENQRMACIVDEDNNLVLAGAGTGKTSVMISRAGYLIKDHQAEPSEILMLAFGNSAAAELRGKGSEKVWDRGHMHSDVPCARRASSPC